ncbi:MAG: hypothetical protein ACD_41C00371G0001 [uncultured bacterium]|nr:MAG: hypothetical protein ACD_41C00371G0001 [uncultured bacterium]
MNKKILRKTYFANTKAAPPMTTVLKTSTPISTHGTLKPLERPNVSSKSRAKIAAKSCNSKIETVMRPYNDSSCRFSLSNFTMMIVLDKVKAMAINQASTTEKPNRTAVNQPTRPVPTICPNPTNKVGQDKDLNFLISNSIPTM